MKKVLWRGILAAVLMCTPALAIDVQDTMVPMGTDIAITSLSASTGLTPPTGARGFHLTVDSTGSYTQCIRYTLDGVTTPTSTVGHLLCPGDSVTLLETSGYISNFKMIQVGASAAVFVSYFQ